MQYTWRPEKYRSNLKDHDIAFEDAVKIFAGPTVEQVDDRFDYGELRIYAIGLVNGVEVTVIYTDIDDEERRIISAWRAEPYERRFYWKTLKKQGQAPQGYGLGQAAPQKRRRHSRRDRS